MGKHLLDDPDVARWHSSLSHSAGRGYLRWLSIYCDFRHMTPKRLVGEFQRDKKSAQDGIEDWLRVLEKEDFAPKSRHFGLNAVKSWFRRNELTLTRELKVRNVRTTPTIEDERVPTRQELLRTFDFADVRTRAMLSCIALAGLRFETISGLQVRDLPELTIKPDGVAFEKAPMRMNIRAEISKSGKPYIAFLARPEFLTACLTERLAWDKLNADSFVFVAARTVPIHGRLVKKGDRLTSGAISMEVRRAMRLAGLRQRPYVWRSYFDTALLNGRMDKDIQFFIMGHVGNIEQVYTLRKHLSDEQIEQIRQDVASVFFEKPPLTEEDATRLANRAILEWIGVAPDTLDNEPEKVRWLTEQLKRKDFYYVRSEEAQEKLLKQLEKEGIIKPSQLKDTLRPVQRQKLIPVSALAKALSEGWEVVTMVGTSKAVVRLPGAAETQR